ncbi:hypothetical protein GIB67_015393 [Kingdonia uniflora]|uniref:Uncharacterized protein n=1 Tax=Kingdonia uniflora TaxID=39325 RepID=A0A7J7KYT7_9MAGN|nr:hypothetical protein GIB67_015393 [Kingdonia uniflora]
MQELGQTTLEPVTLALDNEEQDAMANASCRRNFSMDITLLDAFGHPVKKEMEVVASLLYADNGAPVEKPDDAESPLLTFYDGIEFSSSARPSKLLHGRASFKLRISQCDADKGNDHSLELHTSANAHSIK